MSIPGDVRNILNTGLGLDTSSLGEEDPIFSSGLLDSLSSIKLLMEIEAKFGLQVSPLDVALDDFDSIKSIANTIVYLKDK